MVINLNSFCPFYENISLRIRKMVSILINTSAPDNLFATILGQTAVCKGSLMVVWWGPPALN